MPDDTETRSDQLTAAHLTQLQFHPVEYAPTVVYRGRILWHHLSDAHTVATYRAALRHMRHTVKPVRVPGWNHLLWRVCPEPLRVK